MGFKDKLRKLEADWEAEAADGIVRHVWGKKQRDRVMTVEQQKAYNARAEQDAKKRKR